MHEGSPPPDEEAEIDRQIRIEKMKEELDQITGGESCSGGSGSISSALEEAFLEQALAFERAELDTDFNRLVRRGVALVPPVELDDSALNAKLWEIIRDLAEMRCFLYDTDHLNDRELYEWLWSTGLREETPDRSGMPDAAWHTSPIGASDDNDTAIWLKYYAGGEERQRWRLGFPSDPMPVHEARLFNRHFYLPKHAPF